MPTVSEQLADFATDLRWDALPADWQERARLCLLDALGAGLAGSTTPTAAAAAQLARRHGPGAGAPASIFGRDLRSSAALAALANGVACHALEIDDGHRFAIGLHTGATTIPAALAVAEEEDASLRQLLRALVIGYEVAGRIGTAVSPAHRRAGFHATGTVGVFGAAAAAAVLRRLDRDAFVSALGIAGSAAAGVFEFLSDGSTSKHFHAGHAAMSGVVAADLAEGGMTGPATIIEGSQGFARAYVHEPIQLDRIVDGLGERFELGQVYFKLHAACGHIFSAIDAALWLRAEATAAEVDRITVETYRAAAILDTRDPRTAAEAKFSIPFCLAAAWIHGDVSQRRFDSEGLEDPEVRALADRISCVEDPELEERFPQTRAARVTARLHDGRRLERQVDVPRGMPEDPVTPDELLAKFRRHTAAIIGEPDAERLLDFVTGSGDVPVRSIAPLLTRRARGAAA